MSNEQAIRRWLYTICGLILFMVVFGGYVRLTRSGLSIVEWNVFSGIIPPVTEAQWQAEFAKYQATPEFQKINSLMTLSEYKFIFYNEFIHRLVARAAGLVVIIPLFVFLFKGVIPWRKSGVYWLIASLFVGQGAMGWFMVSSGLVDRPAVSHLRLTTHLLLALFLLAIVFLKALSLGQEERPAGRSRLRGLTWLVLGSLVIQIAYGGLVAGLKAGYVSNTWPLMFGRWVPVDLLAQFEPWWRNLLASAFTVHFVHRWLAFVVLAAVLALYLAARKRPEAARLRQALLWLTLLVAVQIGLGISVIWFGVPIVLALSHQATALLLYLVALYLVRETHYLPAPAVLPAAEGLQPAV